MYAGIILLGIIFAGALERPWPFIIALAAIPVAWYWNRHGSPLTALMLWWKKPSSSSAASTTPAKKSVKWIYGKPVQWVIAIIILITLPVIIIRHWNLAEQGARVYGGFAMQATSRDVEFAHVETKSLESPGRGYFALTIYPDQLTYWGTCGNDQKLHGIAVKNDKTRDMHSADVNLNRGNIVVELGNGQVSRHQDLIYIEDGTKPLSVYLDLQGEDRSGCRIDRPLKATLYFTPKDV